MSVAYIFNLRSYTVWCVGCMMQQHDLLTFFDLFPCSVGRTWPNLYGVPITLSTWLLMLISKAWPRLSLPARRRTRSSSLKVSCRPRSTKGGCLQRQAAKKATFSLVFCIFYFEQNNLEAKVSLESLNHCFHILNTKWKPFAWHKPDLFFWLCKLSS